MHLSEFINQKSYEQVVYRIRRHPVTFLPILFLFLVLLMVPVILYMIISTIFPALLDGVRSYTLLILLGSAYMLTMFLLFYVRFIDFYLDVWIVTNDRIIDIEQNNLFSRSITELELFRIQDVTVDMHGVFATIFNYGNLSVKTASSNAHIIFYNIPRPNTIRERLIELAEEDRKYHLKDPEATS